MGRGGAWCSHMLALEATSLCVHICWHLSLPPSTALPFQPPSRAAPSSCSADSEFSIMLSWALGIVLEANIGHFRSWGQA